MPCLLLPRPLFHILLLYYFQISHAAFTESDVPGTYRLQLGAPSCGDFISIEKPSSRIFAQTIRMSKTDCDQQDSAPRRRCVGGRINLQVDVEVGTAAQLYFGQRREQVGTYLSGPCSARIRCGCRTFFEQNKVLVFFKPEADMEDVSWRDIFVGESDISADSPSGVFDFRRGVKYLMVGARCFYRQAEGTERAACFSGDSKVLMEGGEWKTIREVETGDKVRKPDSGGAEVIGWTHKEERGAWFRTAQLEGGRTAKATAGHLVEIKRKGGEQTQVVRMREVAVGMRMRVVSGDWRRVAKVGWVWGWGLYNFQTMNGEVMVDGTVFTTYTEEVGVGGGHALLVPIRAVAYLFGGAGMGLELVTDSFSEMWRWLLPPDVDGKHPHLAVP